MDETFWINEIDEECWNHQREERELERNVSENLSENLSGLELELEREGEREYAGKLGRVSTRVAIVETTRFVCIVWIAWTVRIMWSTVAWSSGRSVPLLPHNVALFVQSSVSFVRTGLSELTSFHRAFNVYQFFGQFFVASF